MPICTAGMPTWVVGAALPGVILGLVLSAAGVLDELAGGDDGPEPTQPLHRSARGAAPSRSGRMGSDRSRWRVVCIDVPRAIRAGGLSARVARGTEATPMSTEKTRDLTADPEERVRTPKGKRHGLVIGIESYADPRLTLGCARADAQAMYDLMVDPRCGLFEPQNVELLLDRQATTDAVWRALAHLRKRVGEEDTVWIYYAGHAAAQGDTVYWVTHDADVDDLFATALTRDRIAEVLTALPARRVLMLLDCCHAAATAVQKNPVRAALTRDDVFGRFAGRGTIVLAASDGKQKSVELSDQGHGAFTYYLVSGLRGEADADGDGVVTADELWSYLRGKVTEASRNVGVDQTPVLMGELTHDLALTVNAVATGHLHELVEHVRGLVGMGSDQLTTEEGRFCEALLRRPARRDPERHLKQALEASLRGQLETALLKEVAQAALRVPAPGPLPGSPSRWLVWLQLATGVVVLTGAVVAVVTYPRVDKTTVGTIPTQEPSAVVPPPTSSPGTAPSTGMRQPVPGADPTETAPRPTATQPSVPVPPTPACAPVLQHTDGVVYPSPKGRLQGVWPPPRGTPSGLLLPLATYPGDRTAPQLAGYANGYADKVWAKYRGLAGADCPGARVLLYEDAARREDAGAKVPAGLLFECPAACTGDAEARLQRAIDGLQAMGAFQGPPGALRRVYLDGAGR
jgi:uncharacterized caspase-like protein